MSRKGKLIVVIATAFLAVGAVVIAQEVAAPAHGALEGSFTWFAPLTQYSIGERVAVLMVLGVAIAGLLYALMLVRQVTGADQGTPRMQEIAAAVREGAIAYLGAQFKKSDR